MDYSQLLQQIRQENQVGKDYIEPKKNQILKRVERHIKQNKQPGLMNINLVSNTIDTLISGTYIDEPQVQFVSRDQFYENEQSDNLNLMMKFDHKEQDYEQVDYQVQWDRYFFGLGIKYNPGMELNGMTPIFNAINPLTAIYDPTPTMIGKYKANMYKYMGFYLSDSMFNVKGNKQYKSDELVKLTKYYIDKDQELYKQAVSISDNTNYVVENLLLNCNVNLYHHFTIYNGRKWLVTTDSEMLFVLRAIEIPAVTKEEKENPMLIPRPFALYFYKPERGKVFGVSIPDLLEDKEQAKTILMNAQIIRANLEAYGGKYVVNSNLITNKEDVLKPSSGPKYIFTKNLQPGESLDNVMRELPVSNIKQDPMTMINIIERESAMDSKIDQMQSGLVPDKTMTKAEQQSIQNNANMITSLNIKTYLWGEYDFAYLRWRCYQQYFSKSDEKFLLLQDDYEWKSITIKKDSFKTKMNPYINVSTKSDLEAMNEKQKAYWNATLPIILNDPDVKPINRAFAKRFTAKLNGMSKNMINKIYPLSAMERKSKDWVEYFINDNVLPKGLFKNPNDDLETMWIYFNMAEDTKAKEDTLAVLGEAMIQQGEAPQMQQMNQQANSAGNIMSSQLAQQSVGAEPLSRDVLGASQ